MLTLPTTKPLSPWKGFGITLLLLTICLLTQIVLSLFARFPLPVFAATYQGQAWRLFIAMLLTLFFLGRCMAIYRIAWHDYFTNTQSSLMRSSIAVLLSLLVWALLYLLQSHLLALWESFRLFQAAPCCISISVQQIKFQYSAQVLLNEFSHSRFGQAGYIAIYLVSLPLFLEILIRGWFWEAFKKTSAFLKISLTALLGTLVYWPIIGVLLAIFVSHDFPGNELFLTLLLLLYQLLLSAIRAHTHSLMPSIIVAITANLLSGYLLVLPIGFAVENGFTSPTWFSWM